MYRSSVSNAARGLKSNVGNEILWSEYLIHYAPHTMDIFIADLDEDAAGISEEFPGHGETVAQVGEVGVDAEVQVSR